ncbi:MAG TPA: thioredoxin domain-containing protein [Terracidiphilus sp.]|nr:thioredoxin domain-containing protein [Terracidiphilus sp.]
MIRPSLFVASVAALAALSFTSSRVAAQQSSVPAAPAHEVPPAPEHPAPAAPAPTTAPVFPKPDPKNFTATSPTVDTVNKFLQASWGYDSNRVWQVQAILATPVEGISKVIIFIGDKTGKERPAALQFFVLPDGKHIIAGNDIVSFGEHPYAEARAKLEAGADGPFRGAAEKTLELVEFADFECPHCKEAQANMDKLAVDFPMARIVFQNYPLERIHPEAQRAAEYGVCVTKLGGSTAFFQFAAAVFEGQQGLLTADGATLTLNSAVTKAGLTPAKVDACAADPATAAKVEASVKLAQSLNVNQTPTLMINGRLVPIGGVDYATIKKIVEYQAGLDGVSIK